MGKIIPTSKQRCSTLPNTSQRPQTSPLDASQRTKTRREEISSKQTQKTNNENFSRNKTQQSSEIVMNETEELQFIQENLKQFLELHPLSSCQCSELNQIENKNDNKTAIEICQDGLAINLNPLQDFIQTQIGDGNHHNKVIIDVNNKENNICNVKELDIVCNKYLKDFIQKLDYDLNESEGVGNKSILSVNNDLIVIDQVNSSLVDNLQQDVNHNSVLKINQVNELISKQPKEICGNIADQSNESDCISGVNIILDFLKEESPDSIDESKKIEPVKKYLLPFVSDDKKENNDNEDPGWNYLKKLETDEERYKFVRECWKSLVVPDPNVNLTYHGLLRRRQRANGVLKGPSNKNYHMEMSAKRKRNSEEDDCIGNPKKKQRPNILNLDFSTKRLEKAMITVTQNYEEELCKRLSAFKAEKLQKTYDEKIKALVSARHEVLMLHKFYSGLPDQNMSVTQQSLENEQWDIEQLYERFKKHYKWNGRQFFP
ncbi:unnamed protein product [Meganyctiphanes norvegica]|uniref:Uncharacterized protein n=1 Tax=Meganyctiphanes norvegica TaxID=48144 RepID=A0AAV2R2H3_MEGNR